MLFKFRTTKAISKFNFLTFNTKKDSKVIYKCLVKL